MDVLAGPRWCASMPTRRLAPNLNRARVHSCRWCRVAWTTLTAAGTQPTVPASGASPLVPLRASARSKLHVTLKARGGVAIDRHRRDKSKILTLGGACQDV